LDQLHDHFDSTPVDRFHELARLLAIGLRRHFAARAKLGPSPSAENSQELEQVRFEVPNEPVVTVHGG